MIKQKLLLKGKSKSPKRVHILTLMSFGVKFDVLIQRAKLDVTLAFLVLVISHDHIRSRRNSWVSALVHLKFKKTLWTVSCFNNIFDCLYNSVECLKG